MPHQVGRPDERRGPTRQTVVEEEEARYQFIPVGINTQGMPNSAVDVFLEPFSFQ